MNFSLFSEIIDVQSNINAGLESMNGTMTATFRATPGAFEIYRCRLAVAVCDLKTRLLADYERRFPNAARQVRDAVAEAEMAAWHTEFPHLFLPDLAEEAVARLSVLSNLEHSDGSTSFTNVA
jgi:hypothetical protein